MNSTIEFRHIITSREHERHKRDDPGLSRSFLQVICIYFLEYPLSAHSMK